MGRLPDTGAAEVHGVAAAIADPGLSGGMKVPIPNPPPHWGRERASPPPWEDGSSASERLHARTSRVARLTRGIEPYLYASPAVVLIVAVMLVPLALGLSYAFRDV